MLPELMTPAFVADYLGKTVKTVHQLVREGKLCCVQITGRDRRFTPEQIEEFIRSRTITPPKLVDKKSSNSLLCPRKGGEEKSTGDSLSERKRMKEELRSWR
jgi:excisionase family DNA binding protein